MRVECSCKSRPLVYSDNSHLTSQVAIARYFDTGENPIDIDELVQQEQERQRRHEQANAPAFPPPLVDLGNPYGNLAALRTPPSAFDDAINAVNNNNRRLGDRTEQARRVVVQPPAPPVRPSFLVAIALLPLNLGYRIMAIIGGLLRHSIGALPGLSRLRVPRPHRQLTPRDAAARFKRDFEDITGSNALPFVEMSYAQAYDKAKTQPMFLLAVLLSPEHDESKAFAQDVLLHPDVVSYLADDANDVLLWGGSVRDPEAYQVSFEHRVTQFPFAALVCVTPKEGGSTRMGIVKRFSPYVSGSQFAAQLRSYSEKYAEDMASVRAVRVANEASRNIRIEQDSAYERSLAIDRQRAQQKRDAEKAARDREEAAERRIVQGKQWRFWRAAHLAAQPGPGDTNIVRVAIKLPASLGGERVIRSFYDDATVEDLYAFIECYKVDDYSEKARKPENYTHEFKFRIASVMPREVHEPSESRKLIQAIGKSASLVVEEVDEEDDQ